MALDSKSDKALASDFATDFTASATVSAARMDSWTSLAVAFNSSTSKEFALAESAAIFPTRVSALSIVFTTSSLLDFNSSTAEVSDAANVAIVSATASEHIISFDTHAVEFEKSQTMFFSVR